MRVIALIALVGCGRVGFDAVLSPGDDAGPTGDGAMNRDAGGDGGLIDAPASACLEAMAIGVGRTATLDTCALIDRVDGCGPPGTREIVFRFDPPTTRTYTFRAFDGATQNTSNSTAVVNATCTGIGTCAGVLGTNGTAGTPMYLIVEASSGGCASIQFSIQ